MLDTLRGSIGNPELDGELDFILLPFYQFCFPSTGETTVGQNDHDIKLSGALVAETHWSVDTQSNRIFCFALSYNLSVSYII